MMKLRPTAVSGVALAACSETDPGLISDDAIHRDATPSLKCLDRCLRVGPEVAVNTLRRCAPLTRGAVGQQRLQGANDITRRSLLKGWHGTAIGQGISRERVNGAVDYKAGALLEVLHGSVNLRSKYPINREPQVRSTTQCPLEVSYRRTRGT